MVQNFKAFFIIAFILCSWEPGPAKCKGKVILRSQQGVNFNNILRTAFMYESFMRSFFVLAVKVKLYLAQEYWRKCDYKMLVKLTQGFFGIFLSF